MHARHINRRLAALVATIALVSTSCLFFPAAYRVIESSGGTAQPWWCAGSPPLTDAECLSLSAKLDVVLTAAYDHPTLGDALSVGATALPSAPEGIGAAYLLPGMSSSFMPYYPQAMLYTGTDPADRLAGVAHVVTTGPGGPAPDGYDGARDVWTLIDAATGTWILPMWIVRGYEHHPDVFAAGHPCLATGVTLAATTDACFVAAHTDPLDILATNDDGIGAEGIDAIVEALVLVPGVTVTVVAPAENQSGSGDTTTPGGVTSSPGTTISGYPGQAVDGTPADSVLHALRVLGETPDLVVSGINDGQNLALAVDASGTVGAARTAARNGVPAVATSQGGFIVEPDFPAGVAATLAWLEDFRLGLAGPPEMAVANINTPSCAEGTFVRGTIETVVASAIPPGTYTLQDCSSTETMVDNDLEAFNHGFVSIADVSLVDLFP